MTPICTSHILLMGAIHWNVAYLLGAISLKKTDSPYSSSHQMSIAPQSGVGFMSPFPLYSRRFPGLILWRSCVGSHSCCEFMSAVVLSQQEDTVLMQSFWTSGSCNLSNINFVDNKIKLKNILFMPLCFLIVP